MSCIIYTVNCNLAIHATCLLSFMTYKYSGLQMFDATQKLSCKGSCKTPFFSYSAPLLSMTLYMYFMEN
jgi:hypothetical protein